MNKLFSKVATLSVGLAMAIGVGVAVGSKGARVARAADPATETFSHTAISGMPSSAAASATGTYSVFTITVDGLTYSGFNASESVRVYKGASITISVSSGNITSATLTCTAKGTTKYGPGCLTGSGYTAGTQKDGTWTGEASSFTLVAESNQARISDFSITYVAGGEVTTYTISYNANGGSGEMEDTVSANPAVAACGFTAPEGKVFERWNTQADGEGDDYAVGATPGADLDLFAIWMDAPTCVTLTNIGSSLDSTANTELLTVDIEDSLTSETFTLNYLQCKKQGSAMLMTKNVNPLISNHTAVPGNIISVEVFINAGAAGATTYDVAFGTSEFTTATAGIGAVNITGGNSHVFDSNISDAKYFCVTLGNANNGQVLGITINYEEFDPSKKNMTIYTSGNPADGASIGYSKNAGTHVFSAKEGEDLVSGVTWSVSDETVATINASTGAMTTLKPGNVTVFAEAEGYNKASAAVEITKGWLEELTLTGSMSKTSYYVGESWSHEGFVLTATYHYGWEEDVSAEASWNYNPASPALNVTSVTATATYGDEDPVVSEPQRVTVSRTNPIQVLYTKSSGASVDVYGYYVGFLDGTGPVIMDGEYGIVVYNKTADVSGYTEGETILHATGSISIYKGLYEIGSPTISEASSIPEDKVPATPVVYSAKGGETAEYASRLTTVTGIPSYNGTIGEAGASDLTLTFTIGEKTIQVFYKKAAQTADADAFAAIKAAVADSEEITIKGFTGWYNGFQVQMNGYVPPVEDYTAEDFAQDLLDQTDAVCAGWEEGDNNHDALEAIWSDLASNDKYPSLPAAQKTILAEAARDEEGTVVEQAMARYDFLTGKYNLSHFINGRTPMSFAFTGFDNLAETNNTMIIVISIAATSALAFTLLLVFKKKKQK